MNIKCCEVPAAIALLSLAMIIFLSSVSYNVATVSASDDNLKLLPRNATVGGLTLDEQSVVWWEGLLVTALPYNPANDPDGRYCHTSETGSTWYAYENLGGVGPIRHCTIPAGKTIFSGFANECSFDEYPQLKTLDELRSCAKQGADAISSFNVEIDGKPLNRSGIYRITSGPFNFTWGSPNIYGLNLPTGKVGTSIQDGYFFAAEPLPPGEHRIRITASVLSSPEVGSAVSAFDQTYLLTVENPPEMTSLVQNISKPFSNSSFASIAMNVSSSSKISAFAFDAQKREISFQADEETNRWGIAILDGVNRVLTGPYTVTVDGNATRNFEMVSAEGSTESNSIKVYFPNGTHKISIQGAAVVP